MTTQTPQPETSHEPDTPRSAAACATPEHVLIDTHVHLYADAMDAMLDAAVKHFSYAAQLLGMDGQYTGCLMLTETARDHAFDGLENPKTEYEWKPDGSATDSALWVRRKTGERLLILAGGQTVTQEGVEVLSLGTRERFADGQAIDTTIEQAVASGCLPVLPYGLGKWLGQRGAVVARAFERWHTQGVRLGDNAGRPTPLRDPALFMEATRLGLPILAGSDPLRTANGRSDTGRYGVVAKANWGDGHPAESIKSALRGLTDTATLFGRRVGLMRCANDQLALRRKKHLGF